MKKAKEPYLEITEVPWGIDTTSLIKSMATVLEANMKALNVVRIDDESTSSDQVSIKIVFKRGTSYLMLKQVETLLYKKSTLQVSLSANNLMIVDAKPRVLGIREYLLKFVEFRRQTLIRMWQSI